MNPRSTARLAGMLFLVTHVTSVGAVVLYAAAPYDVAAPLAGRPVVLIGALFETVLAVAVTGTSVALYPLVRPFGEGLAAAYVALRTLESSVILAGVVALLPVVAAPTSTATPPLGADAVLALRLVHDWAFLIGPGLVCPVNTVVLAWLLFRSQLVPRWIPVLGLVGGPLIGLANVGVMWGAIPLPAWAVLPIFTWEISLAVALIVRGVAARKSPASAQSPVAVGT